MSELEWVNPDFELPSVTSKVIIAMGVRQNKIDSYHLARIGSGGAFCVSNGCYADSCYYSEKSPHRMSNATRVIAYALFSDCQLDCIKELEAVV